MTKMTVCDFAHSFWKNAPGRTKGGLADEKCQIFPRSRGTAGSV